MRWGVLTIVDRKRRTERMAEVARGGGGVFPGCVFGVGGVCWRRRVWDEHYICVGVEGWEIRSSMAGSFGGLAVKGEGMVCMAVLRVREV